MNQLTPGSYQSLPTVIKNLLIINVLVFLAQNTVGSGGVVSMEDLFALHHVKSPLFQPWQIITHLFLHGGFWHLFSNMFALWMFGAELEYIWGPKRFLTFYFLCGIGAALIQLLWLWFQWHGLVNFFYAVKLHPGSDAFISFYNHFGLNQDPNLVSILQNYLADTGNAGSKAAVMQEISNFTYRVISEPTIGASGAVFGVLAAFIFLFPNRELYFSFFIPVKAKWIGVFYFGYEIFSAFRNSPTDNIAHWAHVGGGLVGFLLVLTWNKNGRRNFYKQ
ncbi:MAG: rhomboid family intramembrane serine protease [Bacteroidota bacterium]|nr:rhomboid family intramembrane serine protease [Bacteroidota bacterium]